MGHSTTVHIETGSNIEQRAPVHAKTLLLVLAVNFICLAQTLNVVGSGAFASDIAAVVGGNASSFWFTSAITIATVVLSPIVSQAADYWGRRGFLVGLTAIGTVGCIVTSRATSIGMAIAGFVISGISFGAQPLLYAVVSEVLPRRYRPEAQASLNVSIAIGAIFALLVGGSLTRHSNPAGFRTFWYITAGFYALSAAACAVLYRPPPRELQLSLTLREKLRRLDWIGYALLAPGLVLFCLGLSWSQNPYSWTNAHVIATFLVGVALAIALIVYETFFKADGMFHHGLFGNRNFPIALGCVFVEGLVFFCSNNYFAFEVSLFYTTDPLRIGLHYSIVFFTFGTFAICAAIYSSGSKTIRLLAIIAFISLLVFNVLMAVVNPHTGEANIWAYPLFLGLGLGICLTTIMTAAQFSTPPELIATTSGLMISVRSLGGSVGLAVYNAVFHHGTSDLGQRIASATVPLGLPERSLGDLINALLANNVSAIAKVDGATPDIIKAAIAALKDGFAVGFRYTWITAASFSFAAVIAACFLFDPRKDFTSHIDAPVEKAALEDKVQMQAQDTSDQTIRQHLA